VCLPFARLLKEIARRSEYVAVCAFASYQLRSELRFALRMHEQHKIRFKDPT